MEALRTTARLVDHIEATLLAWEKTRIISFFSGLPLIYSQNACFQKMGSGGITVAVATPVYN
jgi:hypothetical protein